MRVGRVVDAGRVRPAVRRRLSLRRRLAASAERVRAGFFPVLQSAVAAGAAYTLAQRLLGHPSPFFAGVAAFLCLGISDERRLRRVLEVAVGVTLGVALGDLVVAAFGSGPVQIAAVLAVTVLAALLLDAGQLGSTQAGVQAVLVVALPPTAGGPLARWQDALVGGVVALTVAAVLPNNPVTLARRRVAALLHEIAEVLDEIAEAVRVGDAQAAEQALEHARATQPVVDAALASVRGGREVTRIAPLRRRHRSEVARLSRAVFAADRAIRNCRVVARNALFAVGDGHAMPVAAELSSLLAEAARRLAEDVRGGFGGGSAGKPDGGPGPGASGRTTHPPDGRAAAMTAAASLDADALARTDPPTGRLVLLMRPLAVDLLEAGGMPAAEARAVLPIQAS